AKARLERAKIDPATVAPPSDAFARFDAGDGAVFGGDDPFAQLDSTLDAFAALPDAGIQQSSVPSPQSPVPSHELSLSESSEVPAEPMVDLEAALEEAAAPVAPAIDGDQAVTLDFDAVMNAIDLSVTDATLETQQQAAVVPVAPVAPVQAPVAAVQAPVAEEP